MGGAIVTAGTTVLLASMALFAPTTVAQDADSSIQDENGCSAWNPRPRPSESVRWSGPCKDGWLDGAGTLEWLESGQPTGILATTMRRGRASGFTREQVLRQGNVVEVIEGEYANGTMHGYGQRHDIVNDLRYLGDFDSGLFDGLGTLFHADGSRLEARFAAGIARGFAWETSADGRMILGIMDGDRFNGPGIVYSASRARIETTFRDGQVLSGTPCRLFPPNGAPLIGIVAASPGKQSISCKPSPGANVAEFSRAATDAINAAARTHGYPAKASAANPYAYIDLITREQSTRIRARESEFVALAESEAIPLPDDCLPHSTSAQGNVSAVVFQNRCEALVNVNICVRVEGSRNAQRLKQQAAPNGAARIEFATPYNADYRYEFSYCRPDRTQTLDNCLAACPEA